MPSWPPAGSRSARAFRQPGFSNSAEAALTSDFWGGEGNQDPARGTALPWQRFVLGLDQVLERLMQENPNGLSGAVNQSARTGSPAAQVSPAPGNAPSAPSAADPPAQGNGHDTSQDSGAVKRSGAVDSAIQSLWNSAGSAKQRQQLNEWKRAPDLNINGGPQLRLVYSRETVPFEHDSLPESNGFGLPRTAMKSPLRPVGSDEPSLAAPLAFALLANDWVRLRLLRRLRRSRNEPAHPFREPSDVVS